MCTCMFVVLDCAEDIWRGEVDEGKVQQVMVCLDMAGDYINRRLPFVSAETGDFIPVLGGVIYEM